MHDPTIPSKLHLVKIDVSLSLDICLYGASLPCHSDDIHSVSKTSSTHLLYYFVFQTCMLSTCFFKVL